MAIVLSIDGTPRRHMSHTLSVELTNNGIDSLRVDVQSPDGSFRPDLDAEITLERDAETIFGGLVTRTHERGLLSQPIDAIVTETEASDYNRLADERVMTVDFAEQSLEDRLVLIVAVLAGVGVTLDGAQVTGPTIAAASYRLTPLSDILAETMSLAGGWVYNINELKVLRAIEPGTVAAPFNVTVGDGNTYGDVTVEPTRNEYANRIHVDTGTLVVMAEDTGAQAALGRIVERVLSAPAETPEDQAQAVADAALDQALVTLRRVTYTTLLAGLRPGMTQTINIPARNINNTFLVDDVSISADGVRLFMHVTALEGLVYQTGWREYYRRSTGDRVAGSLVSTGGGGSAYDRFAYPLASGVEAISSPTPTWVPASAIEVQVNTVARGTLSATVIVRLRALSAGVSVQARMFDVTDSLACAGTSAVITSTSFQSATFTATMTAGSHFYRLELLPSAADEPVSAAGYLE